jgi:DNA-binding XRE family transcriptional regulator
LQFQLLAWPLLSGTAPDVVHNARRTAIVKQKDRLLSESFISAAQCRGARGMLSWSQAQLAAAAQVSRMTVVDFEVGRRSPHSNNLTAIRTALEAAGVEFIPENGGGAGVRLRKSQPSV